MCIYIYIFINLIIDIYICLFVYLFGDLFLERGRERDILFFLILGVFFVSSLLS